ncbi:MAG: acyltransferase family protein [Pyrinomonadaceae bacterium]
MSETANNRLISLDAFRGMTIAGMVLVNNPGSWSHIYDPLEHAAWHGLTPTDYIFPFFLFIVGVAVPIALGQRISEGLTAKVYRKIVSRAVMIYLLGAAISILPFFSYGSTDGPEILKMAIWVTLTAALFFLMLRNYRVAAALAAVAVLGVAGMYLAGYTVVPYSFATFRIFGVLQRIAICYLVVSLIFLHTTWRQQLYIAAGILLGYWLLMTAIPVPGCEATTIDDRACNLAAYLDRLILGENHIWRGGRVYDPEGILSTLPAIATTLSGVLTGTWLLSGKREQKTDADALNKVAAMFFFGVVCFAVGWIWNSYFPFNKSLWTSSYVLVTTGLALFTLASCYWLIDIKGYRKWATPFIIFGANALALFVFTGLFSRMIGAYKVTASDGQQVAVQKWIFDNVYLSVAQPVDASLLFAISYILLWLLLMWLLRRKAIYIKV